MSQITSVVDKIFSVEPCVCVDKFCGMHWTGKTCGTVIAIPQTDQSKSESSRALDSAAWSVVTFCWKRLQTQLSTMAETKTIDCLLSRKVLQAIECQGGREFVEEEIVFNEAEMEFADGAFVSRSWVWWDDKHFKNGKVAFEEHKELFDKAVKFFRQVSEADICECCSLLVRHRVTMSVETKQEIECFVSQMAAAFTFTFDELGIGGDTDDETISVGDNESSDDKASSNDTNEEQKPVQLPLAMVFNVLLRHSNANVFDVHDRLCCLCVRCMLILCRCGAICKKSCLIL